jgi:glycosyltransferase involved in cell wall biosynthesis
VRPEDFPLSGEVLDLATGLIVHSRYVEERVRERGFEGPVWQIAHPAWPAPAVEPARIEGDPVIGAFGNMNASKRVPQLLDAFERFRATHPDARLLLVGAAAGLDLDWRIEHEGLRDAVLREDYVGEERLWALMTAVDVVASLRSPTMGETSGTAIRALSLGKPLLVSDVGWFSELPDDVALKASVDERETDTLADALETLADPAVRATMGAAARALAEGEHDVARVAEAYVAALEEALGGRAVQDAVLREVSEAAAAVGIDPASQEAATLARALDEVDV